ncbi:MAG: FKBP-type peptidyl-prolyl cis-trans isomerase [bacterium]|nr:FKBP-type peptidyl-prolyl cis-trans isomerase [bacterium]
MASDIARRIGSIFLAFIFILTTLAFTGLVYLQTRNQDKASDQQAALQEALAQANQQQAEEPLPDRKLEGFKPITTPINELKVKDISSGDGQVLKKGDQITVHYTGAFAMTGLIFGSSRDDGKTLDSYLLLSEEAPDGRGLLQGWVDGLPGMKVGGKRQVVIPADKAYGEAPAGYVPSSAGRPLGPLVFEIELIAIK